MNPGELPHGVRTHVTIQVTDFDALGRWLADQTSESQAELLVGLTRGINAFGTDRVLGKRQNAYIAAHFIERDRGDLDILRDWLEDLRGALLLIGDQMDGART